MRPACNELYKSTISYPQGLDFLLVRRQLTDRQSALRLRACQPVDAFEFAFLLFDKFFFAMPVQVAWSRKHSLFCYFA